MKIAEIICSDELQIDGTNVKNVSKNILGHFFIRLSDNNKKMKELTMEVNGAISYGKDMIINVEDDRIGLFDENGAYCAYGIENVYNKLNDLYGSKYSDKSSKELADTIHEYTEELKRRGEL